MYLGIIMPKNESTWPWRLSHSRLVHMNRNSTDRTEVLMAAARAKRGLASLGTATGVAVALWELRRKQVLSRYEEMKRRYVETGSETRFPFYGRDFGYEVDYMLELQLQAGDRCLAAYSIEVLPLTHAAVLMWQRKVLVSTVDEEAVIEVINGQRFCRHPKRPGFWWQPWWFDEGSLTRYSDWLAWPPVKEVRVCRSVPLTTSRTGETCFTVRWKDDDSSSDQNPGLFTI